MTARGFCGGLSALFLAVALFGCSPNNDYQTGDSQTSWLRSCHLDTQCDGGTMCLCGVCTRSCSDTAACASMPGSSCITAEDTGAVAQCSGNLPATPGLCMPTCDHVTCPNTQMCVAGVCTPLPEATVNISVDSSLTYQTLVGFGASIAYGESSITTHPQSGAIYQAIFQDLGLDVLRFRNRYEHTGDDDLTTTSQLIAAGTAALGHAPEAFLTSWSPPPALKADGSIVCLGNDLNCTLSKTATGSFDYDGFASYWRDSLTAYANIGVVPDYIGIQNNPDWIPSAVQLGEACKFLPTEGSTTVSINGVNEAVTYPGFAEAQAATLAALSTLPSQPKILAPETSDLSSVASYMSSLDRSKTAAIAHQFYGVNPNAVDVSALGDVRQLASQSGVPVFVTEMQADGFSTAVLIHYATVAEGASAYLQTALTSPASGPDVNTQALLALDVSTFSLQDPYHALRHFAHDTDPGWTRVNALSDTPDVLASAWLSPSEQQLTLILINASSVEVSAAVSIPAGWTTSSVTRSVFSGVERSAALGRLSTQGVLRLPAEAVTTIALSP